MLHRANEAFFNPTTLARRELSPISSMTPIYKIIELHFWTDFN
jgi:hypothetical protein